MPGIYDAFQVVYAKGSWLIVWLTALLSASFASNDCNWLNWEGNLAMSLSTSLAMVFIDVDYLFSAFIAPDIIIDCSKTSSSSGITLLL